MIAQTKGERTAPLSEKQVAHNELFKWLYTATSAIPGGTPILVEATAVVHREPSMVRRF
jgi:hypothetical protein